MWKIVVIVMANILKLSILSVGFVIATQTLAYNYNNPNSDNILPDEYSDDFRSEYAAEMLSFMNRSVSPCDDFYEYACGNWKNVIRPRYADSKRNYLLDIDYKLTDIAIEILERPDILDVAPQYDNEFQLAKKFYYNCLQTDLQNYRKSPDYLHTIQQIGGFPALDPLWDADKFSWLNMSAYMSNYGIESLIKEATSVEYPFHPFFFLPSFGLDIALKNDSIDDSASTAYQANSKRMRTLLSLYDVAQDQIDTIVDGIFDFLKAALTIFEVFDDNVFKCEALANSANDSRSIEVNERWEAYFEIAWMGKVECLKDDHRPCSYLYYELDKICEEHKEAVANYLSLKFLHHLNAQLTDETFHKDYCAFKLRNVMDDLFDHLFMEIYANHEALNEVKRTIDDMKPSLRTIIEEADWLDEETRQAALMKESYIKTVIGRYENPEKVKRLIGELKNLQYVDDNYEANNLNLMKYQQFISRYNGLHSDEYDNTTKPLALLRGMQANAFYYNNDNTMYVMAGVLYPPMFHKTWPNSLKYGTLGFLVGHEFTHAFDTIGAKYDHDGVEHYWWSEESGELFMDRAECFIDHFEKFYIPEINRYIDGNTTRDENIADAGGLRVALLAYRRFIEKSSKSNAFSADVQQENEQLPELDLTPEQLFFLGAAQLWCSAYEEAHYLEELSNVHTIDKYRVLGMNSNNADFAKAFNCPLESKMNPSADKCIIW